MTMTVRSRDENVDMSKSTHRLFECDSIRTPSKSPVYLGSAGKVIMIRGSMFSTTRVGQGNSILAFIALGFLPPSIILAFRCEDITHRLGFDY